MQISPPAASLRFGQLFKPPAQHAFGGFPGKAGVGDGNAMAQFGQFFGDGLVAFAEIAFDHRACEGTVSGDSLLNNAVPDVFLAGELLGGIRVTAVNHERWRQTGFGEFYCRFLQTLGVVIGLVSTAAQYEVAIGIAIGPNNGRESFLVNA